MRKLRTIEDADFDGKRVLIRFDFNTPVKNGVVDNDERIVQSLPTLKRIIEKGGIPVMMAHLGRPKGEHNDKYTLKPVCKRLEELLDRKVKFLDDITSPSTLTKVRRAGKGDVILLENIRYEKGEEKNDPALSKTLAAFGDVYVNDAFGCVHRNHASTEGVTHYIKECYAGYLMEKELRELSSLKNSAKKPFAVVVGGSKISSKITVLESFLKTADIIVIGGGMAYTFLKAQGHDTGKSMVEDDYIETARSFLQKAEELKCKVVLPVDHVCAAEFAEDAAPVYVENVDIPADMMALDIGRKTVEEIRNVLGGAKTVFWNGPVGVFEFPAFAEGTNAVAKIITDIKGARTVVGGGDSVSALAKSGLSSRISHISTGGGASLEFLEGRYFAAAEPLYARENQRKMLVGNWKMNMTKDEALAFAESIKGKADVQNVYLAVAPEFPVLDSLRSALAKSDIEIWAQNLSQHDSGAYTGEVSAAVLESVGIDKVILGHSERRNIYRESSSAINAKVKKAIENKFKVILCVGESEKIRDAGKWAEFLTRQLANSIRGIKAADVVEYITVAYEPVWAIGTGKNATSAIAEETISTIRTSLARRFGQSAADRMKILYGGSVKPENAKEYVTQKDIDGVLVGGASLVPEKFLKMAEVCSNLQ